MTSPPTPSPEALSKLFGPAHTAKISPIIREALTRPSPSTPFPTPALPTDSVPPSTALPTVPAPMLSPSMPTLGAGNAKQAADPDCRHLKVAYELCMQNAPQLPVLGKDIGIPCMSLYDNVMQRCGSTILNDDELL